MLGAGYSMLDSRLRGSFLRWGGLQVFDFVRRRFHGLTRIFGARDKKGGSFDPSTVLRAGFFRSGQVFVDFCLRR